MHKLGYVLIHPEKEDFVAGIMLDHDLQVIAYVPYLSLAKIFKNFKEIEHFLKHMEDFYFDVAKLFDVSDRYFVEYETSVSSSPIF